MCVQAELHQGARGIHISRNRRSLLPLVGEQEPGTEAEIKAFAAEKGATFPLFEKTWVNGANANPIWDWLKLQPGADGEIAWNFVKFLVSKNGKVLKRYESSWNDAEIRADIAEALKEAIDTTR